MNSYDNRSAMISDLEFLLHNKENISSHMFQISVDNIIWNWTGFGGKIGKCERWTIGAVKKYEQNKRKLTGLDVQHEHVVPRNVLIQRLANVDASTIDVETFLNAYALGVVTTREEHERLHTVDEQCDWSFIVENNDCGYVFSRYRLAGVTIVSVKREGQKIVVSNEIRY